MKKYFFVLLLLTAFAGRAFLMEFPAPEVEVVEEGEESEEEAGTETEAMVTEEPAESPELGEGITEEALEKLVKKWIEQKWLSLSKHKERNNVIVVTATSEIFDVQRILGSKALGYLFELWSRAAGRIPGLRRLAKKGPRRRLPYFAAYLKSNLLKKHIEDLDDGGESLQDKIFLDFSETSVSDSQIGQLKDTKNVVALNLQGCNHLSGSFLESIRDSSLVSNLIWMALYTDSLEERFLVNLPVGLETLYISSRTWDFRTWDLVEEVAWNGKLSVVILEGPFSLDNLQTLPSSLERLEISDATGKVKPLSEEEVSEPERMRGADRGCLHNLKEFLVFGVDRNSTTLDIGTLAARGLGKSLELLVVNNVKLEEISKLSDTNLKELFIDNCLDVDLGEIAKIVDDNMNIHTLTIGADALNGEETRKFLHGKEDFRRVCEKLKISVDVLGKLTAEFWRKEN